MEGFADKVFEGLGLDIFFTNHFYAQLLNDQKKRKEITDTELRDLIKNMFLKVGDNLEKLLYI